MGKENIFPSRCPAIRRSKTVARSSLVRSAGIRIKEVPEPTAGPGQIVVEVARNGICGSDLHTYAGSGPAGVALHVSGWSSVTNSPAPSSTSVMGSTTLQ